MGIVGAAIGVAGSIYGGIQASKAMNEVRKDVKAQQRKEQDEYDRDYNEDFTQRADAQRLLNMTEDSIKRRNKAASGAQAVMGGSEESVQATKEANADALAQTAGQLAVNAQQRKDALKAQHNARQDAYNQQLSNLQVQKAQSIAQATQGVGSAVGDMEFGDVKMFGKDIPL